MRKMTNVESLATYYKICLLVHVNNIVRTKNKQLIKFIFRK